MTKNNFLQPVIYSLLIIIGVIIGSILRPTTTNKSAEANKINSILKLINTHYVDTLNIQNFNDKTINAVLNELDPHSNYINARKLKNIEEDMQGSFSGIGVQFNIIQDSIVVISPISGGPSKKLGIQSGDRIVIVDGEDVASVNIQNEGVIKKLRGEKGSTVNIKVYRRGVKKLLDFAIIRDDIPLYSIDASYLLKKNIGYIKINRFSATTFDEFLSSSYDLLDKGMKDLVLDLRGNPGGYLSMAVNICDEFLSPGNLIVYTEGRNRPRENYFSTKRGALENIGIIVLIDEGSASASEIIAGAVQDNDRGVIIGRRSFGKGTVQEQIPLKNGDAVRLTTSRYYTPSGRCIQKDYGKNPKEYFTKTSKIEQSDDSLIFTTKKGRLVYGGGGINPDIKIQRDSTLNFYQINLLVSKGLVNEFCVNYSLKFKSNSLSKEIYIKTFAEDDLFLEFLSFVKEKDKNIKLNIGTKETIYLKNLLKASLARNIWDDSIFYQIINSEDEFVQQAINELN